MSHNSFCNGLVKCAHNLTVLVLNAISMCVHIYHNSGILNEILNLCNKEKNYIKFVIKFQRESVILILFIYIGSWKENEVADFRIFAQ